MLVPDSFRNLTQELMESSRPSHRTRPNLAIIDHLSASVPHPPSSSALSVEERQAVWQYYQRVIASLREFLSDIVNHWDHNTIRAYRMAIEKHDWYAE